jgi:hypothetical protein
LCFCPGVAASDAGEEAVLSFLLGDPGVTPIHRGECGVMGQISRGGSVSTASPLRGRLGGGQAVRLRDDVVSVESFAPHPPLTPPSREGEFRRTHDEISSATDKPARLVSEHAARHGTDKLHRLRCQWHPKNVA